MVSQLFRHESGKMLAVLTRLLGFHQMELAQDIVQDSLLKAMNAWRFGIPENPSAWLYRVAKNTAVDYLRREKRFRDIARQYAYTQESEYNLASTVNQIFGEEEIKDSQLRMIFACCHPQIAEESQIALVLKTLCGLSVPEIARAFLSNDDTIAKRIFRAKEKIKTAGIGLDVPLPDDLPLRTDSVLKCLYLLFNEGYNSSHPDTLIRKDLCDEAIRLCSLLTQYAATRLPRVYALLALMHFQASRLNARLDDRGNIILLKFQDRQLWDRYMIQKGFELLEYAAEPFEASVYHLEAAIASLHASAADFEKTDWKSIYHLYEVLYQFQQNPMVALNKAIASSYAFGREQAMEELKRIRGLETHHLYHATMGELYLEMRQNREARASFETALRQTPSAAEQQLLLEKIQRCGN